MTDTDAARATDSLDRITQAATALEAAQHERDQAIRDAHAAGKPVAHIAHAANVTRQTVYNIIARQ